MISLFSGVLSDTVNLIVILFREHEFNETQKITLLDESELLKDSNCASRLAKIIREIGDYIFSHHYSIAFPTPVYELMQDDEKDKTLLIRHKYPRFTVEIQDECKAKELANAMKKAGEFLNKKEQLWKMKLKKKKEENRKSEGLEA